MDNIVICLYLSIQEVMRYIMIIRGTRRLMCVMLKVKGSKDVLHSVFLREKYIFDARFTSFRV